LGEFQVGAALVQADPAALDFVLDLGGEFIDRSSYCGPSGSQMFDAECNWFMNYSIANLHRSSDTCCPQTLVVR
jgi:hypothetical protein